jgi:hypothetical protein
VVTVFGNVKSTPDVAVRFTADEAAFVVTTMRQQRAEVRSIQARVMSTAVLTRMAAAVEIQGEPALTTAETNELNAWCREQVRSDRPWWRRVLP